MIRLGPPSYNKTETESLTFDPAIREQGQGKTPDQVVAERLKAKPVLTRGKAQARAGPCDMTKAHLIADRANEVSQPDS